MALIAIIALVTACGGGDEGPTRADSSPGVSPDKVDGIVNDGNEGNPLSNTEWRLVALGNAATPAEVVGGNPTAEFTTAADLTGWTGCNSYAATYSVGESELRLDDLRWTERGCPSQALFRQEQRMQDSLATVQRFEVSGERLTLHGEGGQALVFEWVGE